VALRIRIMADQFVADATAVLVFETGDVFYGLGVGATGSAVGEVCFNTAITGYQEILTDPSYASQIVCFTFPHIGNTGTTIEDEEATTEECPKASLRMMSKGRSIFLRLLKKRKVGMA